MGSYYIACIVALLNDLVLGLPKAVSAPGTLYLHSIAATDCSYNLKMYGTWMFTILGELRLSFTDMFGLCVQTMAPRKDKLSDLTKGRQTLLPRGEIFLTAAQIIDCLVVGVYTVFVVGAQMLQKYTLMAYCHEKNVHTFHETKR